MKKLLLLLLLILIGCSEPEPIDSKHLKISGDVYYLRDTNKPYTGQVYGQLDGYLENGTLDGTYKLYYGNGNLSEEGTYSMGEKDGVFTYYHDWGGIDYSKTYKNGKRNGETTFYDDYGKMTQRVYMIQVGPNELNMDDTQIHGSSIMYYDNGQIKSKSMWDYGKQYGPEIEYYRNGNLKHKWNWESNGEGLNMVIGDYEEYYENGNLEVSSTNKWNEKRDGIISVGLSNGYYENGKPHWSYSYNNHGERHGLSVYYGHDNGQISSSGNYEHGKKEGPFYNYNENGFSLGTTIYKDGKKINVIDGPKWKNINNWKKLKTGMSMSKVRQILGIPYGQDKESRRGFSIRTGWYYDESSLYHSYVIFSKTDEESFLKSSPERGEYRVSKWKEISY